MLATSKEIHLETLKIPPLFIICSAPVSSLIVVLFHSTGNESLNGRLVRF
jgi:hypothetical protein